MTTENKSQRVFENITIGLTVQERILVRLFLRDVSMLSIAQDTSRKKDVERTFEAIKNLEDLMFQQLSYESELF